MKKIIFFILLCHVFYFQSVAQTDSNLIEKTDSLLNERISLQDTTKLIEVKPKIFSSYIVKGIIRDAMTEEIIPFATVFFPNSAIGKKTNDDGTFEFDLKTLPNDTLIVSVLGYAKKKIVLNKNEYTYYFNVELETDVHKIKEVVIRYDKNPGWTLIKKVIANKEINNYDKAANYSYEVYNKLELDINKIPKGAFNKNPVLKDFSFINKYIDTTSEEKPFLPLFLTESISDYYYQKKPKKTREFIKGSRTSGYKNSSVQTLLGSMYQNINVYSNSIDVFDVKFISPIADNAGFYYSYEITDTQKIDGLECYHVFFTAKRKGDRVFDGDIWIHENDYALKMANLTLGKDQNINWVNKVSLFQEFKLYDDTLWFLIKDKFYVDFLITQKGNSPSYMGKKTTTYKNIIVNNPKNISILEDKKIKENIVINNEALDRNENYWNDVRHDSLSKNEKAIYKMIDTIQSLPVYKKYYNTIYFLSTGIKEFGPLEIGSLYNLYSRNPIEGTRVRLNLGTTPKLFKNIYLNGYVAYGFNDNRFKYNANALWLLKRKPRMYLFASIKSDIDNSISFYDNNVSSFDNIFNTSFRKKGVPWKLAFVEQKRFEFFNEFHNGFKQMLSFEHKKFSPYSPLPYQGIFEANDKNNTTITTAEIGLELRFDYLERFIEGNYYRTSLGTKYPAVKLYLGLGLKDIFQSQYQYQKIRFAISDYQAIRSMGGISYTFFAGKILGTLPYPILEVHPGNEFYFYNGRTFNMMNRFEYISDTYVGLFLEHTMGPLFFKYIPQVKKMKLRTFWTAKGAYGKLSTENQLLNQNKGYDFQTLSKSPYFELGTGIENIFRIFRVDFVWRVMPERVSTDTPARKFGIFGSFKFAF